MGRVWNEEEITRALKPIRQARSREGSWEGRVWAKIEASLERPEPGSWMARAWQSWVRPHKWAFTAACLVLALSSGLVYQRHMERQDMEDFLLTLATPATLHNPEEEGMVPFPLSDPSPEEEPSSPEEEPSMVEEIYQSI